MACPHNPHIVCSCPKECPRHANCCACVAHHREHGKLPHCFRDINPIPAQPSTPKQ